jgi:hypothetical protein
MYIEIDAVERRHPGREALADGTQRDERIRCR